MVSAICIFSIYTAHVFPAFNNKWAPAQRQDISHVHYGFGWGFAVIMAGLNLTTSILGFALIYEADHAAGKWTASMTWEVAFMVYTASFSSRLAHCRCKNCRLALPTPDLLVLQAT